MNQNQLRSSSPPPDQPTVVVQQAHDINRKLDEILERRGYGTAPPGCIILPPPKQT
jgi:hypothetical protein